MARLRWRFEEDDFVTATPRLRAAKRYADE
jgi:hypothetical protein